MESSDAQGREPECSPTAAKKARLEANPDIPLTTSAIPAVQQCIAKNNAHTRPRFRLRTFDFLNRTFGELGLNAAESGGERAADVMALFDEFVAKHRRLPSNTALSKVLYRWADAARVADGMALVQKVLQSRASVPAQVFSLSFDEKVATVSLRIVTSSADVSTDVTPERCKAIIGEVLEVAGVESLKRRALSPLFAFARRQGDWPLAESLLGIAAGRDLELWDAEYNDLLVTISAGRDRGEPEGVVSARLGAILKVMSEHQPVVGADNARLIQALAGGAMDHSVADDGTCSRCGAVLHSFDLLPADRAELVRDIEEKLIKPRVEGLSRYEPEKVVSSAERDTRWAAVHALQAALESLPYDTVIDGANIGYYGLSSWYKEARREKALEQWRAAQSPAPGESSSAEPPANLFDAIPDHPPFPVDVAPKFAIIESMRKAMVAQGKRPVIILHERHLNKGSAANMATLAEWRKASAVLASPAFLNDDYCWLHAAIVRPGTFVVSNDQMRDHHFLMLSLRIFMRWRQRHRITYKAYYVPGAIGTTVVVSMPRVYSVWVQPAATADGASYWHVPYVASIPILDQATNRTTSTGADAELSKDGDDNCSAWVCTLTAKP